LGNDYCESFNSKLRDELLDGEIFYTLEEARVIIENCRRCYNEIRPHLQAVTPRVLLLRARLRNLNELRRPRHRWRNDQR